MIMAREFGRSVVYIEQILVYHGSVIGMTEGRVCLWLVFIMSRELTGADERLLCYRMQLSYKAIHVLFFARKKVKMH